MTAPRPAGDGETTAKACPACHHWMNPELLALYPSGKSVTVFRIRRALDGD